MLTGRYYTQPHTVGARLGHISPGQQTPEMMKFLWSPVSGHQEDLKAREQRAFSLSGDLLTCSPTPGTSHQVQTQPALILFKQGPAGRQAACGWAGRNRAVWDSM